MDIKDKLRLAICMSQSKWSGLIYNTKENYEKFDAMLKEVDEEYRTTLINFAKYKLVMFAMAKLMERGGADAVVAEGMESGGHIGQTTTMALLPQVVDAVNIPVIGAGGIADGRGIAAA